MMDRAVDKGVIWDILNTSYRAKVAALHSQSLSSREPIGCLARREAEQRISSWGRENSAMRGTLHRWFGKMLPRRIRARQQVRHYAGLWAPRDRS